MAGGEPRPSPSPSENSPLPGPGGLRAPSRGQVSAHCHFPSMAPKRSLSGGGGGCLCRSPGRAPVAPKAFSRPSPCVGPRLFRWAVKEPLAHSVGAPANTPTRPPLRLHRVLALSFSVRSTTSGWVGCSERAEHNSSGRRGLRARTAWEAARGYPGLPHVTGETTGHPVGQRLAQGHSTSLAGDRERDTHTSPGFFRPPSCGQVWPTSSPLRSHGAGRCPESQIPRAPEPKFISQAAGLPQSSGEPRRHADGRWH